MTPGLVTLIASVACVALFVYLIYTLIRPERF